MCPCRREDLADMAPFILASLAKLTSPLLWRNAEYILIPKLL